MKKTLAILLAAAMLLSIVGCGGSVEPAETAPATTESVVQVTEVPTEEPTEIPTEAPAEAPAEPAFSVEDLFVAEDTKTEENPSWTATRNILKKLGFEEIGKNEPLSTLSVGRLTYNSQAFKMEFSPLGPWMEGVSGWVLYGMKSDTIINMTNADPDNYLFSWPEESLIYNPPAVTLEAEELCPRYEGFMAFNMEGATTVGGQYYLAIQYPQTRNLYNFIYTSSSTLDNILWIPSMMAESWTNILGTVWKEKGVANTVLTGFSTPVFYEPEMTWVDWVASKYNVEGWSLVEEDGAPVALCSALKDYYIPLYYNQDGAMMTLGNFLIPTVSGNGQTTFGEYAGLVMTAQQWEARGDTGQTVTTITIPVG